jgi:hypothetical protein
MPSALLRVGKNSPIAITLGGTLRRGGFKKPTRSTEERARRRHLTGAPAPQTARNIVLKGQAHDLDSPYRGPGGQWVGVCI